MKIVLISLLSILIGVWDMKFKKIPNTFILVGIGIVFVSDVINTGMISIVHNLILIVLSLAIFILLWGVLGGGDVKYLILLSLLVGIKQTIIIFLISTIIASLFYVVKSPKNTLKNLKITIYRFIYQIGVSKTQKQRIIAYSPFIIVAFYINVLWIGGVS